MTDTTLEEASRCPTCREPGKQVQVQPIRGGGHVRTFSCENTRCEDEGERWLVQINPDGSVPQPGKKGPKAFERPRENTRIMQVARDELALMDFMSTHPDLTEREARRAMGF